MLKALGSTAILYAALLGVALAADSATKAPEWNYSGGANNDEGWGELSPAYAACTIGTSQSPVGINYTTLSDLPNLSFRYRPTEATIGLRDRALIMSLSEGSSLSINNHNYALKQIRFHTPSEHSVLGREHMVEIHLVHQDDKGALLIVAVFVDLGAANEGFSILFSHLEKNASRFAFNANDFLPAKENINHVHGYYSYTGSITTPPCTENVEWRILKTPITLDRAQLAPLANIIGRNARLAQPLYMRTVYESKD